MQRELKRGESLLNHDHTSQTGAASRRGPHSGGYSWRGLLKGSHFYPGAEQIPHNSCHLSGPASGHGLPNEDIVTGDGSPPPSLSGGVSAVITQPAFANHKNAGFHLCIVKQAHWYKGLSSIYLKQK